MARIRTHTNPFNYFERMAPVDFSTLFPDLSKIDVEIGFGRGVFLRHWAAKHPDRLVIGIEVRKQIVKVLEERCQNEGLSNTYLAHGQGLIFIEDCVPAQSVDNVFIFHPDPWFKKRHHNRRVVSLPLLNAIQKALKSNGQLHISTDVGVLWDDITEKIEAHGVFNPIKNDEFWDNHYASHWSVFSEKEKRDQFFATFVREGYE